MSHLSLPGTQAAAAPPEAGVCSRSAIQAALPPGLNNQASPSGPPEGIRPLLKGPGAVCSSSLQHISTVSAQRLQPECATANCSM